MFIPEHYRAKEPRQTIREYPFATLITSAKTGPLATATPLYFKTDNSDENVLIGHISTRNPQSETLIDGANVLAVFNGPHAYISASWYETPPLIPTWNYLITQVRGKIRTQPSNEEKKAILSKTAERAEGWNTQPWTMGDAASGEVDGMLNGIYAFEIEIQSIAGADKLSQTRTEEDFSRVISKLEERNFSDDQKIANHMRKL